jgi:hypothetical protein
MAFESKKTIISLIGLVFLVLFFANSAPAEAAFGVSPPFVGSGHLVPGSKYIQTIYLVQDNPGEDLKILTDLQINDRVRSWFVVNGGKEMIIPKGVRQYPVEVIINVPKKADLGIYKGLINFSGMPLNKTGQITIALGVEVKIGFTVGEGIFRDYEMPLVNLLDIEEGWSPKVQVKFVNNGNVPEAIDSATYELFDQFGSIRLAYIQKNDGFTEVAPFSTEDLLFEFPINLYLGIGDYWGSVNFLKEGKVIGKQRTVFKVLKAGSLSGPISKVINHLNKFKIYYLSFLGILIVAFIFYRRFKNKKGR